MPRAPRRGKSLDVRQHTAVWFVLPYVGIACFNLLCSDYLTFSHYILWSLCVRMGQHKGLEGIQLIPSHGDTEYEHYHDGMTTPSRNEKRFLDRKWRRRSPLTRHWDILRCFQWGSHWRDCQWTALHVASTNAKWDTLGTTNAAKTLHNGRFSNFRC